MHGQWYSFTNWVTTLMTTTCMNKCIVKDSTHAYIILYYYYWDICYYFVGLIFHWLLVLLSVFWLLHLIHLFLKIAFPMWSRTLNVKRTKIILHVTEVGGATLLSGLAPIIFVSVSEYNFGRFPPVLCFPSRAVTFYTMCLPVSITIGSGVILAIITFWILHKVSDVLVIAI